MHGARLAYSSDAAHNGSFPPQNPGAAVGFKLRQVPLSQYDGPSEKVCPAGWCVSHQGGILPWECTEFVWGLRIRSGRTRMDPCDSSILALCEIHVG